MKLFDPNRLLRMGAQARARSPMLATTLALALAGSFVAYGRDPSGDPGTGGTGSVSYENDQTNALKTLDVPIKMWVAVGSGPISLTKIGNIEVRVNSNVLGISGDFLFKSGFEDLDDSPRDFQWINVLQEQTIDGIVQTQSTLSGPLPSIDPPPSDGPTPYYWSEGQWANGIFNGNQIRSEGVGSRFMDRRALPTPTSGTSFDRFRTYLVAEEGFTSFCVLGGFEWIYSHTPSTGESIGIVGALAGDTVYIDAALQSGVNSSPTSPAFPGYPGWTTSIPMFCQTQISGILIPRDPWWNACNSAAFSLEGLTLSGGADLNGDAIPDFVSSAPTSNGASGNDIQCGTVRALSGSTGAVLWTRHGAAPWDHLGVALSFVGDINGDGVHDVAIGTPQSAVLKDEGMTGPGYVTVVSGTTGSTIRTIVGTQIGDSFGASLANMGDLDGDGINDLAVGQPWVRNAGIPVGAVRVVSLATGAELYSRQGSASDDMFGLSLMSLHDLDGDGVNDWAAGAPRYDHPGGPGLPYVRVVSGATGNTLDTLYGQTSDDAFGLALSKSATAGGPLTASEDLFIGAPRHSTGTGGLRAGAVYRYVPSLGAVLQVEGQAPGDHLGASITWVSDFDGDGLRDLAVGAPQTGLGYSFFGPGYVSLWSGASASSVASLRGGKAGDGFGAAVACLGDVTGDGLADILVGSPFGDDCGYNAGGVSIYAGLSSAHGEPICTVGGLGIDHITGCPCGNNGLPGNGCGHSFDPNGANLAAAGTVALDDIVLHSQFEPSSAFTLMMQHSNAGDSIFHDGVLCAANPLIRLRGRAAVGGECFFPNSLFVNDSTTTLSARGGTFPGSGSTKRYAAWYRNASTTFCPPATANVTNGWVITW